eukprot:6195993-Pleurochrysis_carterae.AAC.1
MSITKIGDRVVARNSDYSCRLCLCPTPKLYKNYPPDGERSARLDWLQANEGPRKKYTHSCAAKCDDALPAASNARDDFDVLSTIMLHAQ